MILGIVTRMVLIQQVGQDKYNKKPEAKVSCLFHPGSAGIVFVAMALKAKDIVSNPMLLPVISGSSWPSFTWAIFC